MSCATRQRRCARNRRRASRISYGVSRLAARNSSSTPSAVAARDARFSLRRGQLGYREEVALDERLLVHVDRGERVVIELALRVFRVFVADAARLPELALELLVHAREPAEVGAGRPFSVSAASRRVAGEMAPDELLGGHAAKVLVEGGGRVAIGALRADGRRETGLSRWRAACSDLGKKSARWGRWARPPSARASGLTSDISLADPSSSENRLSFMNESMPTGVSPPGFPSPGRFPDAPGETRIVFSTAARPVNALARVVRAPGTCRERAARRLTSRTHDLGGRTLRISPRSSPCVPETELRIPKATCFRHKIYAAFVMCGIAFVWRFSLRGACSPLTPFPETPETQRTATSRARHIETSHHMSKFGFSTKAFGRSDFLLGVVTSTRLLDRRVVDLARFKRIKFRRVVLHTIQPPRAIHLSNFVGAENVGFPPSRHEPAPTCLRNGDPVASANSEHETLCA